MTDLFSEAHLSGYEPELGQVLFGNAAYSEYDLGQDEGFVEEELYDLSRRLGTAHPDEQHHGFLGGEWGYGQDFSNDVFEMHPYWWGDCDCGFAELEAEWWRGNPHADTCWLERYHAEWEQVRGADYDSRASHMDKWAAENGWDGRPGVAAYCDCGADQEFAKWAAVNGHDASCRVVLPNFRCGDVEVRWYKYIGRGMSVNRVVTRDEWRDIFRKCLDSLAGTTTGPSSGRLRA